MGSISAFLFFTVIGIFFTSRLVTSSDVGSVINNFIFSTKCLKDLGCFYNGPPFYHPILRPISLLPFDLKDMRTKFWLCASPKNRTLIEPNKESLEKSHYNKSLGLHIYVHGYDMNFTGEALETLEDIVGHLQKSVKSNVILVDWSATNKEPYPQAVANGRVVGAQTAQLIKFLQKETGLDARNIHIIGHSLGAHVAGWAGERISKLGRITGLDPAGPYFRHGERKIRLDDTDANFVDIIHTNAAEIILQGAGIEEPIGHIDFYPNGGSKQPGCERSVDISTTKFDTNIVDKIHKAKADFTTGLCSHLLANDYFTASMDNSKCKFIGTQCEDYEKYKSGQCASYEKAEMGFHAKKNKNIHPGSKFYLCTLKTKPFCIKL